MKIVYSNDMNIEVPAQKNTLKILIVDDDEEDFFIIRNYIKNIPGGYTFTIQWCGGYQEAVKMMGQREHDIYFVDFRLGPKTGLDLIQETITNKFDQPVILLTGAGNRDIDMQAMEAGAADYLVKSELNTEKMERCIRYAVSRNEFLIALKANEQKYRGIFENTKDFIFVADERFLFTEVNAVCTALFGYTREEMHQLHLDDLLVNKKDASIMKEDFLGSGEIKDRGLDMRSKNDQIINCLLSMSARRDGAGPTQIQGIIHDITSLKKAEQATLQTARLKAGENLVRVLAHEVRNPLNNIILASEQLSSVHSREEKILIDIIQRNSDRINKLVTELLNSSRPASICLQQVTLQSVLDKSITAARDRMILKKIKLSKDYHVEDAWIMADPEKLSIAFLNIIINGIEASRAEDAKMNIQLKEERGNFIVSITDNGSGISEDNLGKLFEPYYTSKSGGMGLGLSSALNIFESHRVLVNVTSSIGSGTCFNLVFNHR